MMGFELGFRVDPDDLYKIEKRMAELRSAVDAIERAKARKPAPPPPPKMRKLPDWF